MYSFWKMHLIIVQSFLLCKNENPCFLMRFFKQHKLVAFAITLFIIQTVNAQRDQRITFNHLNTSNGLSNNQINSIFQDDIGNMWFGTLSGLNRYDGHEVVTFYHSERDSNAIINNTILWMANGPDDKIWVSTAEGICNYDPETGRFGEVNKYLKLLQATPEEVVKVVRDRHKNHWFSVLGKGLIKLQGDGQVLQFDDKKPNHQRKIASGNVTDMSQDAAGHLWIAHASGCIQVVDPKENRVIRMLSLPEKMTKEDHSWQVFVDADGDLWLYSYDGGGLYIDTSDGSHKVFDQRILPTNIISSVMQYDTNSVLIGTDHGGVSIVDKRSWKVQTIKHGYQDSKSLSSNKVKKIFRDDEGGIWIGTAKSGVNYHHQKSNNLAHFRAPWDDPDYNDMSSFVEDPSGTIYIGTNGAGVLRFDPDDHTFSRLLGEEKAPNVIVSLLYSDNTLWIGSYLEGLFVYSDGHLDQFRLLVDEPDLSVWDLYEDSKGSIWIGTLDRGVYSYDPSTEEIEHFDDSNILISNYVTCIEEDDRGRIWFGTGSGITIYNPTDGSYQLEVANQEESKGLSNNSINSIMQGSDGKVWVGTLDGLNVFEAGDFRVLRKEEGLASNIVQSVEEDDEGAIWVSTSEGLSKIKNDTFSFQSFDMIDGLQGDLFTEDASLRTSDGYLLFGGQNGFNRFHPKNVLEIDRFPKLLFTYFFVGTSNEVQESPLSGRTNSGGQTDKRVLDHSHHSFTIGFNSIAFFQSEKINYRYKLDGLDLNWNQVAPGVRQATYANVAPGEYTFHVQAFIGGRKAAFQSISLPIEVLPSFWQSSWGYAVYFLVFGSLIVSIRLYVGRKERKKSEARHQKMEVARKKQMDEMKMKFFTNVSHEFKTPLSLVLTPLEQMVKKPENVKASDLKTVYRNAKRLMTMVNQLLDFRKMEANQHVLNLSNGDFVCFLQGIVESFHHLSKEKTIALDFVANRHSFYTRFDRDKIEKVMFNLLSNAFKFTDPEGTISVELICTKKEEGEHVTLQVSDNGMGIDKANHERIFDRFFQADYPAGGINNGTGIGLSIAREFVELHGGNISVTSQPGEGTTFLVKLPLRELVNDPKEGVSKQQGLKRANNEPDLPTVLVVEDNFDFRNYLKDSLSEYYQVHIASNGKEALKMVRKQPVDMVVSDVMMPEMDGYELCRKIKSDSRTSFIPVLLLTAQTNDESKVVGLKAGAIEFISKPFNFEVLISSIESALNFSKQVKSFEHLLKPELETIDIVSRDQQFVEKAVAFVELNLSNSSLSVEDLSHELGYSRGHLYQKMLKITGQTPIDFIRDIRMERASELLCKSELNVSEVAYKVGYNNPKLFSRYFKKKYHSYPSGYRAAHGHGGSISGTLS